MAAFETEATHRPLLLPGAEKAEALLAKLGSFEAWRVGDFLRVANGAELRAAVAANVRSLPAVEIMTLRGLLAIAEDEN